MGMWKRFLFQGYTCIFNNIAIYFSFFFSIQIQNAVKAGFVYGENKDILIVADDCETLLTKLQERAANKEKIHRVLPNV